MDPQNTFLYIYIQIPEVPKRDQLALALAEKASKAHRAKKEEALKHVTRRLAS